MVRRLVKKKHNGLVVITIYCCGMELTQIVYLLACLFVANLCLPRRCLCDIFIYFLGIHNIMKLWQTNQTKQTLPPVTVVVMRYD